MTPGNCPVWGIHAGKYGDAHDLFIQHNVIAIGWPELGDLLKLDPTRDAFYDKYRQAEPTASKQSIANSAGQPYRFAHECEVGDFVVYRRGQEVRLAEVTGPVEYHPDRNPNYPQQRPVKWAKVVPASAFSLGALHEAGSAMSFFSIRNYADEFLAALAGEKPPAADPAEVAIETTYVAENIRENTRAAVLALIDQHLKGHPLAHLVAHLLEIDGYGTRVAPPGADAGVDIDAHRGNLVPEPPIIKAQVKSGVGSVGRPDVQALYGNVAQHPGAHALFVTMGAFSPQAKDFARGKTNLTLVDGEAFVELLLDRYERLDAKYRTLIPLQRVFIPGLKSET